jgi:glycylpeptide N-tetradecanoyltransferase
LLELYNLLKGHYVEDTDGEFRFEYSMPFLRWALNPPEYQKDWILGIRAEGNNKLCAFISGIPVHMTVQGSSVMMAEINFLCSHKNLRDKRIAPTLIKEITRRVNLCDVWQAVYTAGKTLPTPFATAQYWHRNLNPKKLIEVGFSYLPAGKSLTNLTKMCKFKQDSFVDGFREMQE